jgi:hypothetical protein
MFPQELEGVERGGGCGGGRLWGGIEDGAEVGVKVVAKKYHCASEVSYSFFILVTSEGSTV